MQTATVPKLNPAFVLKVKAWLHNEAKDLAGEWIPSPVAKSILRMWESECPTMAAMLKAAGILEPYAEMMDSAAMEAAKTMPGNISECLSEALKDMIPSNPEMEATWIQVNQAQ